MRSDEAARPCSETAVALRCLAHPWSLVALAVLALNDHLWKGVGPGWLTGKLSDFAGLFYFPFLVIAACGLVSRPRWHLGVGRVAFWCVALWFAAAKTLPWAHEATQWFAAFVVGDARVVRDPTDVIALVALWPAWRLYRRAAAEPWPVARALRAPVVCIAVILTAATSRIREPEVVRLVEQDGTLFALVSEPGTVYASTDGVHWERNRAMSVESFREYEPRRELATPRGLFRLDGPRVLVVPSDGAPRVAWELPEARRGFVEATKYRWQSDPADMAALRGGEIVVVAVGTDGVVCGTPSGWVRVGVGPTNPPELQSTWRQAVDLVTRGQWWFGAAVAILVALVMSMLTWIAPAREPTPTAQVNSADGWRAQWRAVRGMFSRRIDAITLVVGTLGMFLAGAVVRMYFSPRNHTDFVAFPLKLLGLGLAGTCLVVSWICFYKRAYFYKRATWRDRAARPRWWRLVLGALLGGIVAIAAVIAWDTGRIASLDTALGLTLIVALIIPFLISASAERNHESR